MGRTLKLVYRGNFGPWWSTETQLAATLEAMGHVVVRAQEINEKAWDWDAVVRACDGADVFLWTQTTNVDPDGGYKALKALSRAGVPTVSFHLDLYWGLARQVQIMEHPFWRTDYCLTADGGHQEDFARNGVNHFWCPPAVYEPDAVCGTPAPQHAVKGTPDPQFRRWPVIFVGSYPYPHPEHAQARRDLILNLQSRFGARFRHYRGGVRGQDLADLYASATVVVGDSCLAGRSARYYSDRLPETIGRAGFLVHPHVEGLEEQYIDGEHLRTFEAGDIGQMISLVQHYLANPTEARRIGLAGQAHVRQHHTYRHRMESMLELVGLAPQASTDTPTARSASADMAAAR